ncbi:uncharacterized protein LOC142776830 [Rhipicephalus microplus]|uniref:uncharacterized protein LOC142776830 n=1 Tax=Rhipicephalus microplus TaxID=6941 RepID=UPI003F6CC363
MTENGLRHTPRSFQKRIGCSVSVPHDHTDFERRAFHDSSAAASTSATSQVRQRDSFELAPTGSNEEQVCERGSVDSLLAFRERLQAWALQSRASHTSVTSLLRVLQSHECFSALPSTARALLQTPKKCLEVLQLAGGKYHHFGLSAGLQRVLQDCAELPRILKLSFNIDGLPVSKSSRGQFWCILGRISNLEDKAPFIVGVFFGSSKPNNANDFLRPFVCDINAAITTGITIGETAIPVSLYALICDAPAKAFVLYVRSHTGYYSCTKCDVKGVYCEGRVCFPNVNARKRTDDSFRLKVQEEHHTGESILEELPFDLVKDIPLDYMHLVCLGVMNKLLTLWVRGPKVTRLGSKVRLEMSEKNSQIARCVPCDFSRKPRSIAELDRWKATEFRFFLLYGGPVVLSSLIPAHMYKNFLALHVGISVLSTPAAPASEIEYAGNMLKFFIRTFISIYGKEHVSHNVHGLCHLADDVTHLGPLDSWSAFPFENHMSSLKRMLRKPDLPLEQLCNRLAEQAHRPLRHKKTESHVVFAAEHADGPLVAPCRGPEFKKVTLPGNVILRAEKRNGCCRLSDGSIVVIDNFAHLPCGEPCIIGRKFLKCEDFYSLPCPSSILGIYSVSQPSSLRYWPLKNISQKCLKVYLKRKSIVFPLLHATVHM